ncbi:MAG: tRNA (adenosine(37)-N6)-threonylcarbamoyltransferase complex dimerization subunit type 1 TsaB [Clostridiales bacterium]|jgi:tRNA threonylcarbamoyladenosine biosynthesis protein TsaB|nr:tRNA (adenosine(37)-N6)-threonylcarbamoyltransferase complex dimerization subunit type 1 TsaB [Clostridiales bacterium]
MRILAIETSAKAASVAITDGEKIESFAFQNRGLTHSRTLMPMVRDALRNADLEIGDVDVIAAASGPGSFTGLRIGVAAAKGIAWSAQKPGIGVSTLEAMARVVAHIPGIVCCVMDARRGEYYNAIFESDGRELKRVCEDRAVPLDDLEQDLASNDRQITLVGDGAPSAFSGLKSKIPNIALAPPHLMHQSAIGVAFAASEAYQNKSQDSPHDLSSLNPVYIRRPQAERERLEREQAL